MRAGASGPGGVPLAAYAVAGFAPSFIYNLVVVMYLYFATVILGASPGVVGMIFLVSKIWDGVSDPMAGFLSDRTRSRLGRRRPWLLGSSVPIALLSWMLFAPPASLEGWQLEAWIAVGVFGFYTAYTAFEVPHMALGAELSQSAQVRNRVFGARQFVRVLSMVAAYTLGVSVVRKGGQQATEALALGMGALTIVVMLLAVRAMPGERADYQGRGPRNAFRAVADVWGNPDARLLLFVYFVESMGTGAIGVLVPFVLQYVMKMPDATSAMLMVYTGCTLAGIPLWVALGRRHEKRRLWLVAMLMTGFGFGMLLFVGEGDWPLMALSSLLAGTGGACGATLGQALKADLVDVDEHRTGERKEGAYFAAWSFVGKVGGAIMIGTTGLALEWAGFDRELAEQPATVKEAMLLLMGGAPLVLYSVGALIFSRFRLSEVEHARIRAALDARAAAARPDAPTSS